jgi:hypothetical protein
VNIGIFTAIAHANTNVSMMSVVLRMRIIFGVESVCRGGEDFPSTFVMINNPHKHLLILAQG